MMNRLKILLVLILVQLSSCGGGSEGTEDKSSPRSQALVLESESYKQYAASINGEYFKAGVALENFEEDDASLLAEWRLGLGWEFPGASGSFSFVVPDSASGKVLALNADLTCGAFQALMDLSTSCGRYVEVERKYAKSILLSSLASNEIFLKIKVDNPLLSYTVRLTDAGGQVFQYPIEIRSIASNGLVEWQHVKVPLGAPAQFWGGAGDGVFRGGVASLSFLAGVSRIAHNPANLMLDDIRLVENETHSYAITTAADVHKPSGGHENSSSRLAIAAHVFSLTDAALQRAQEAGISTLRIDLFWSEIERNNTYDFSYYERLLAAMAKRGLSALFILDYGHPDHGGGAPVTVSQRAAFVRFAKAAAAFAANKNVIGFEVWNEPDNDKFWAGGDPQTYAELFKEARSGIAQVDSNRNVINGGPSWVNIDYVAKLVDTGALVGSQNFAIHPYRTYAPETFGLDLARLKALLASKSGNPGNVWITEWGYSSYSALDESSFGDGQDVRARHRQAKQVLRTYLTGIALDLELITLYELKDSGHDPKVAEQNYGLIDADESPKPSYLALKRLNDIIKKYQYEGVLKNTPVGVHAMRWRDASSVLFVVWASDEALNVNLISPGGAEVFDWLGNKLVASGQSVDRNLLSEANGPIIIRIPQRPL
jgi:Cellulase (glycosyl hydrolase family 5)